MSDTPCCAAALCARERETERGREGDVERERKMSWCRDG